MAFRISSVSSFLEMVPDIEQAEKISTLAPSFGMGKHDHNRVNRILGWVAVVMGTGTNEMLVTHGALTVFGTLSLLAMEIGKILMRPESTLWNGLGFGHILRFA